MNQTLLKNYLVENFDTSTSDLEQLRGGEHSRAYGFSADGRDYVLRVNRGDHGFRKDEFAAKAFGSTSLPIPETHLLGRLPGGEFISVTSRCRGVTLDRTDPQRQSQVLPATISMLNAIHSADISSTRGFGGFNPEGVGGYASWRQFLLSIEQGAAGAQWPALFRNTCMETKAFDELFGLINQSISSSSEDRHLVHGDVGMDNAIYHEGRVTGVLDWGLAKYGDPLFDVAWLHLWWTPIVFADVYRSMGGTHSDTSNFNERLRCYLAYIGLASLAFFAMSRQTDKYDWLKARLGSLGI